MTSPSPSDDRATPRGPEAVSAALFEATERLCMVRPPGQVTVRQIAAEAGVNHGLVHHYFGSKPALLGATMVQIARDFERLIRPIDDAAELVETFFLALVGRPSYPRLMEWLLLEGYDPTEIIDDFPLVRQLRDSIAAETGPDDAGWRTQAVLAFAAGWTTANVFLGDAAEIADRDRDLDWATHVVVSIALGSAPST